MSPLSQAILHAQILYNLFLHSGLKGYSQVLVTDITHSFGITCTGVTALIFSACLLLPPAYFGSLLHHYPSKVETLIVNISGI